MCVLFKRDNVILKVKWWVGGDSNPGPLGYEPSALTS